MESKSNQRSRINEWVEEEINTLKKMKEKSIKINIEATAQDITNLNEMLQNVNEKNIELAELVSDNSSDDLVNNLKNLTDMVIKITKYFYYTL